MSSDNDPQQGCLVIADISGYTAFLAGSELQHAQGILDELLGDILKTLAPQFETANLEGDAVFCYAPAGRIRDGQPLIDLIEATYAVFMRTRERMELNTTCPCQACSKIPDLGLKFVAHFGAYAMSHIGDRQELAGPEVVLVHRLLKNSIIETTGVAAYAYFTDACIDALGLAGVVSEGTPHEETYEHLGLVPGVVQELEAAYTAHRHDHPVVVADDEVWVDMGWVVPTALDDVWAHLTEPELRAVWFESDGIHETGRDGAPRGPGTTQHCAHGRITTHHQIVDWRPYESVTYELRSPLGGRSRYMIIVEPTKAGTSVRSRFTQVRGSNPLHTALLRGVSRINGLKQALRHSNELLEEQLRATAAARA